MGDRLAVGSEGPLRLLVTRDPSSFAFCASRLVPGDGEEGWQDAVRSLGQDAATAAVVDPHDLVPVPRRGVRGTRRRPPREPRSGRIRCDGERAEARLRRRQPDLGRGLECAGGWCPRRNSSGRTSRSPAFSCPPGRHHVALVYEDPWVTAGLATSLSAWRRLLVAARRPEGPDAGVPGDPVRD